MKKLICTVLVLCAPQLHAMQMETARKAQKENSCADTCYRVAKGCCYLTMACGLLTSGQPVHGERVRNTERPSIVAGDMIGSMWRSHLYGQTMEQKIACNGVFEKEVQDSLDWIDAQHMEARPELLSFATTMIRDIEKRDKQRDECAFVMRELRREECTKLIDEMDEDHEELRRLLEGDHFDTKDSASIKISNLRNKLSITNECFDIVDKKYELTDQIRREKHQVTLLKKNK